MNIGLQQQQVQVQVSLGVREKIIDLAMQEKKYGARPLKRLIAEFIEDELSLKLLSGKNKTGSTVRFILDKKGQIVNKILATV